MLIHCILNQVIAVRTINTSLFPIKCVLLASVTPKSFNIIIARTLSALVTLASLRSYGIALTWLAPIWWESILICLTLVTFVSSDARFAVTMSCKDVTGRVITANRVAVAVFAAVSRSNIPIAIFAFVTVTTDDICFTVAVSWELERIR